jgi:hypothetical protein
VVGPRGRRFSKLRKLSQNECVFLSGCSRYTRLNWWCVAFGRNRCRWADKRGRRLLGTEARTVGVRSAGRIISDVLPPRATYRRFYGGNKTVIKIAAGSIYLNGARSQLKKMERGSLLGTHARFGRSHPSGWTHITFSI